MVLLRNMISEKSNDKLSGSQNPRMDIMLIVKAINCQSLGMLSREKDLRPFLIVYLIAK